jgi:hypothetical protein
VNCRKQFAECKLNKKQSALINGSPLVSGDFSNKFLSFLQKNRVISFRIFDVAGTDGEVLLYFAGENKGTGSGIGCFRLRDIHT